MDPQIAAAGSTVVVMWTTPGTDPWGDGPLATSVSLDGGRTWKAGPNPADDGSTAGHAFLELSTDSAARFYAFWLDSRDGAQGLRGAVSTDRGQRWAKNVSLDVRTCECCWNKALSLEANRMALLYRDTEPRDMALAVTEDGGLTWTRRATVGAFNWGFNGCPHVGGGLAQTESNGRRTLHAIVWTGAEGREGLYATRSQDGGYQWSVAQRLATGDAKHADIAGQGDQVAAVWDRTRGGASAIMLARSRDAGGTWEPAEQIAASPQASHPLVVASAGHFVVFWTEKAAGDGPLTWRTVRIADRASAGSGRLRR
jgi:hypothetical protein